MIHYGYTFRLWQNCRQRELYRPREGAGNAVSELLRLGGHHHHFPAQMGKTSLVNQVTKHFSTDKSIRICHVDIFNCRTEGQFYQAYARAALKANATAWDDFLSAARKYHGRLLPSVTHAARTCELSF